MSRQKIKAISADEKVIIVDRRNRPVDVVPRQQMRREGLIHRATYILVFNTEGHIFAQKRTLTKDFLPGYYDLAAGGVLRETESYLLSARREMYEELGIRALLKKIFDFYLEVGNQKMWGRAYHCTHNGPFSLQAAEIESGNFYTVEQVFQGHISPITADTRFVLKRYIEMLKK
jgi:8-oxo-dGTP pyrophosphatase MutT (NUDIX family)